MNRIRIAPVVEGHGEDQAVRTLLQRLWLRLGGEHADVLKPIRGKRQALVREADLQRAIGLAALKLSSAPADCDGAVVLLLVDADDDLPCVLGPNLLSLLKKCRDDIDSICVIANREYETWFVAAAGSLGDYLDLPDELPTDPEGQRAGKQWVQRYFRGTKYSETVDQPRMSARMDLDLCRERSPSFDKLWRELELRRAK